MTELPKDLIALCEKRMGNIYCDDERSNSTKNAMNFLGIAQKSEFYKFYSTIIVNNMYSDHEYQELIPILDPQFEINSKIEFAWNTWLMPKRYIAMTTLEGEGGYFYDKDTGAVADYENGNLEDLIQGNVKILNDSIFDFMRNFLS